MIIKLEFLILANKKTLNCRATSAGMCFDIFLLCSISSHGRQSIKNWTAKWMFVNISASAVGLARQVLKSPVFYQNVILVILMHLSQRIYIKNKNAEEIWFQATESAILWIEISHSFHSSHFRRQKQMENSSIENYNSLYGVKLLCFCVIFKYVAWTLRPQFVSQMQSNQRTPRRCGLTNSLGTHRPFLLLLLTNLG